MKFCKTCGREKHEGLCDMAELDNGQIVHASRIRYFTDAGKIIKTGHVNGVLVKNRWRKNLTLGAHDFFGYVPIQERDENDSTA